jgi:hypothetical protein
MKMTASATNLTRIVVVHSSKAGAREECGARRSNLQDHRHFAGDDGNPLKKISRSWGDNGTAASRNTMRSSCSTWSTNPLLSEGARAAAFRY